MCELAQAGGGRVASVGLNIMAYVDGGDGDAGTRRCHSFMITMDGQSSSSTMPLALRGCGEREGWCDTHGSGGGSDEEEPEGGDGESVYIPTEFGSRASCMPGDLTDADEGVVVTPDQSDDNFVRDFTDGNWKDSLTKLNKWQPQGPIGRFGMFCGNFGSFSRGSDEQNHVFFDVKRSPCQILMLQEANQALLDYLREPVPDRANKGVEPDTATPAVAGPNTGEGGKKRKAYKFVGYCSDRHEKLDKNGKIPGSLLIAATEGVAEAMHLLLFRVRPDGLYTVSGKSRKGTKRKKMAVTRIMVAALQMRFFRLRGRGGSIAGDDDELVLINVHLNFMTAKKEIQNGAQSLKMFWDELAEYIIKYGARILGGDWNMALWTVVYELRARGIQVNLAAWYPWKEPGKKEPLIDSMGVFIIGPVDGIQKLFDASHLEIPGWETTDELLPHGWGLHMQTCIDTDWVDPRMRGYLRMPYTVREHTKNGQGYPLSSYAPRTKEKANLHRCTRQVVEWAMAPAIDRNSSAVAEVCQAAKKAKGNDPLFSIRVDPDIGRDSWDWSVLPKVVQKPVDFQMFVGKQASTQPENIFTKGAHMPLMTFFGSNADCRRGQVKRQERDEKAANRGRGWSRANREQRDTRKGTKGGEAKDDAVVTAKVDGTSSNDTRWWRKEHFGQHYQQYPRQQQQQGQPWAGYNPSVLQNPPQGTSWVPPANGHWEAGWNVYLQEPYLQYGEANPWKPWRPDDTRGSGGTKGGGKSETLAPRPSQTPACDPWAAAAGAAAAAVAAGAAAAAAGRGTSW